MPSLLMAPIVSAATGTNTYNWASEVYLFVFLLAAASAAAPGVLDVSCTYDWASVSLTVTSRVAHFPCFHGSSVTPSGRFPSVLSRPDGSFNAGMSAFAIACHTTSFRLWCLAERPLPPLHDRPCSHLASTDAPQGHWWGSHMLAPSRRPTAMWMARSSSRRPQPDSGSACSQSLLWGDVTESSRALSVASIRLLVTAFRSDAVATLVGWLLLL